MSEIKQYIDKIVRFENLSEDEAIRAFQIVMTGGATPVQIAALIVGLRMKGESVDEIAGAAEVMRARASKINSPENAIDTCGTGGDNSGSYNISTAVAFVLAACGIPVAKHGNRAVSSKSGSADVLSELGVNIMAEKELMEKALHEANICFLMAQKFHNSMRHVSPIRQELGMRTIFNVLGPLSNPADIKYQVLGVYSKELIVPMAEVLAKLGTKKAWVVHGEDGMDEITTTGITHVAELNEGKVTTFEITPEDVGLERVTLEDLEGGDVHYNAGELSKLLKGKGDKAYHDIVLINAAAGLLVAEKVQSLQEGVAMADEAIKSGKANEALLKLVEISNMDIVAE